MFMLSESMHSEFIATPELLRATISSDSKIPAILIKSSSLSLKYMVNLLHFSIIFGQLESSSISYYGVLIEDDPRNPLIIWSPIESTDEVTALSLLSKNGRCKIFLYNEGSVNVCSAEASFQIENTPLILSLVNSAELKPHTFNFDSMQKIKEHMWRHHAQKYTNLLHCKSHGKIIWKPFLVSYIHSKSAPVNLELFSSDEGAQQENLALWITDMLSAEGSIRNPQIHEPKGSRELTDILVGTRDTCFLIESKSLSVFTMSSLPERAKLKKNIIKSIKKAVSQLTGACKNIKKGHLVTTKEGLKIDINLSQNFHCIVLIPDLHLLSECEDLGGSFIVKFANETENFLHILDPTALLRSVQHAEMVCAENHQLSMIDGLQAALVRRCTIATTRNTPNFDYIVWPGSGPLTEI